MKLCRRTLAICLFFSLTLSLRADSPPPKSYEFTTEHGNPPMPLMNFLASDYNLITRNPKDTRLRARRGSLTLNSLSGVRCEVRHGDGSKGKYFWRYAVTYHVTDAEILSVYGNRYRVDYASPQHLNLIALEKEKESDDEKPFTLPFNGAFHIPGYDLSFKEVVEKAKPEKGVRILLQKKEVYTEKRRVRTLKTPAQEEFVTVSEGSIIKIPEHPVETEDVIYSAMEFKVTKIVFPDEKQGIRGWLEMKFVPEKK